MIEYKVTVDEYGVTHWRNAHGELHREDGPAVESINGHKAWFLNNKRHREDGPAIEWSDGDEWWYLHDKRLTEEEFIARTAEKS